MRFDEIWKYYYYTRFCFVIFAEILSKWKIIKPGEIWITLAKRMFHFENQPQIAKIFDDI